MANCAPESAAGGASQCESAKLKGLCAHANSWVRSRCTTTCCGIDATDTPPPVAAECEDDSDLSCWDLAAVGRCTTQNWVRIRCPATCGTCGATDHALPPAPPPPPCADDPSLECGRLAEKCSTQTWVRRRCARACGACEATASDAPPPPAHFLDPRPRRRRLRRHRRHHRRCRHRRRHRRRRGHRRRRRGRHLRRRRRAGAASAAAAAAAAAPAAVAAPAATRRARRTAAATAAALRFRVARFSGGGAASRSAAACAGLDRGPPHALPWRRSHKAARADDGELDRAAMDGGLGRAVIVGLEALQIKSTARSPSPRSSVSSSPVPRRRSWSKVWSAASSAASKWSRCVFDVSSSIVQPLARRLLAM